MLLEGEKCSVIILVHGVQNVVLSGKHAFTIAVIAVAPTGKASFVYIYVQTRLRGQYNGK